MRHQPQEALETFARPHVGNRRFRVSGAAFSAFFSLAGLAEPRFTEVANQAGVDLRARQRHGRRALDCGDGWRRRRRPGLRWRRAARHLAGPGRAAGRPRRRRAQRSPVPEREQRRRLAFRGCHRCLRRPVDRVRHGGRDGRHRQRRRRGRLRCQLRPQPPVRELRRRPLPGHHREGGIGGIPNGP